MKTERADWKWYMVFTVTVTVTVTVVDYSDKLIM